MRRRYWRHSRVGHLAVDRRDGPKCLALDVSDRGSAGLCRVVDPAQHPGIDTLGGGERAPPRSARAERERRGARRSRCRIDALHGRRSFHGPFGAPALCCLVPDDAVGDLRVLGVGTFIPTYVGNVATKAGLSAAYYSGLAGFITSACGIVGFVILGFLADAIGRKPTAMLYYAMCLVLTPLVYLWGQSQDIGVVLSLVGVFGFFTLGIWAWAPVWLPELFPTRMRGTAVAFCFNAPRFISCLGPLIAGTLIAYFGGFGPAATIVGLFFILGVVAAPFLPETNGMPLPHALWQEARTPSAEAAS